MFFDRKMFTETSDVMTEQIKERLEALREEFKAGQEILADLETRQSSVRNTLLRISGAIQVLEELLKREQPDQSLKELAFDETPPVTAQ